MGLHAHTPSGKEEEIASLPDRAQAVWYGRLKSIGPCNRLLHAGIKTCTVWSRYY